MRKWEESVWAVPPRNYKEGSRQPDGETEPRREGLSFSFLYFYDRLNPDLLAE